MTLESKLHHNARQLFNELCATELPPRLKRKPSVWASEVRIMPIGGPISGNQTCRYDHSYTPHMMEVMDAADDPSVALIVYWGGVRDGKTAASLGIAGRTVTDDPGGIYDVHPTDDDCAKFSNDDVEPMIELCLEGYFVEKKSRDSGRTIDYKKYKGGSWRIVNAGGITKFRGSTVKALFMHEVDGYGRHKESIYKALNRTQGIKDAIIFIESTGTLAPTFDENGKLQYNSVIHEFYDQGDKRKWFCACRSCGALQWLKYPQIQARDGNLRHAAYYCEQCDESHNARQWQRLASGGRWLPTAGLSDSDIKQIGDSHRDAKAIRPEIRSYWRNGFNSLLPHKSAYASKLHEFLAEGEAAKASPEALKTWTNEIAAELWDSSKSGEAPPDWKPLYERRESYNNGGPIAQRVILCPERCLVITAGVDVHKNRLEVEWTGNGRNEESWTLDHVILPGEVEDLSLWKDLAKELSREFPWGDERWGTKLELGMGFIDAGKWPEWVFRFLQLKSHPGRVRACRGSPIFPHPLVDCTYRHLASAKAIRSDQGTFQVKGHWIGTDAAKDLIYTRLRLEAREGEDLPVGWHHFGMHCDETYFQQLTAEKVTVEFKGSDEIRRYKNDEHLRNEVLDCRVYSLGAFRVKRWPFDQIERELREQAAAADAGTAFEPKKKEPMRIGTAGKMF